MKAATATRTARPARPYIKVNTAGLAAAVAASGYSHSELAVKAKLKSPATISNLTSGYRRTCHRDTAKRLAKALKMNGALLFEVAQ